MKKEITDESCTLDQEHDNQPHQQQHISYTINIPAAGPHQRRRRRRIHRVPPQLRVNEEHVYDPVVLALGPYHEHGRACFALLEEFKREVLSNFVSGRTRNVFYGKILERIDEIRSCYVGVSREHWPDEELAEMMLCDACFLVHFMHAYLENSGEAWNHIASRLGLSSSREASCLGLSSGNGAWNHMASRLGLSSVTFLLCDISLLENQIPLSVVRILLLHRELMHDHETITTTSDADALICKFLSEVIFGDHRVLLTSILRDKLHEPLHLLEASRIAYTTDNVVEQHVVVARLQSLLILWRVINKLLLALKRLCRKGREAQQLHDSDDHDQEIVFGRALFEVTSHPFRSVTNLKAKGIHFRPSSYCLKDIRFSSGLCSGQLHLPVKYVSKTTKVFFSNIVAFEMSPENDTDVSVMSYINFMKSLIETAADVKELREKGILFSDLGNDEEVVRLFKDINTYGCDNPNIYGNVKMRVEAHCQSKAKTWVAELNYTYFRSPWTAIALLAAIFLLCLTLLQTYFTIQPVKNNN